ncbi:pseudouridine-5'-phosphatase-like isoform X2 [Ornithodoros turicata]|uniref:pseudouridine-5'-phosphatase-like isoform X2 n=1 Tax=Ornithodoros turicata TaxID=34597 RepID=UPI0031394B26
MYCSTWMGFYWKKFYVIEADADIFVNRIRQEKVWDTEKLYTEAIEDVAQRYGKHYTWDMKVQLMGSTAGDCNRKLLDLLQLPIEPPELATELDKVYLKLFPTAELMPGAERLVRHLHRHKIPFAIATSSKRSSFELKTSRHKELFALFHHATLASDDPDIKHGKPAPDVFLVSARRFEENPAPAQVLVFEDAPHGVEAALAAGMQVVLVPDPRLDETSRSRATLCLASLTDFKPELFGLPPYDDC